MHNSQPFTNPDQGRRIDFLTPENEGSADYSKFYGAILVVFTTTYHCCVGRPFQALLMWKMPAYRDPPACVILPTLWTSCIVSGRGVEHLAGIRINCSCPLTQVYAWKVKSSLRPKSGEVIMSHIQTAGSRPRAKVLFKAYK